MTLPSRIHPGLLLKESLTETDLDGSLLLKAAVITLRHLSQHKSIGLTRSGAFNRKFVVWAVDEFQWPGYMADELYQLKKVLNEEDVLPISILHELLRAAEIIRHAKGKAGLTKSGRALLYDPGRLQVTLFETFFTRHDFGAFERWPIQMPDADTFHFLGVVKNRLEDWVSFPEFAGWCLPISAIPPRTGWQPEQLSMFYLATRLVRPLTWLGLLEQRDPRPYSALSKSELRKTPLFDKFMTFPDPWHLFSTLH